MGHLIRTYPFNRTIVELKYPEDYNFTFAETTFNRTIVELKFTFASISISAVSPF